MAKKRSLCFPGLVPGLFLDETLETFEAFEGPRVDGGEGREGEASKRRKPSKASKVRTKALKPLSKPSKASKLLRARTSLLYPCFKTAFCYGVVSGCFVPRVSPSSQIRPELAPKRGLGLGGPGLAFRTPESARKVHAKTSGP